MYTGTAVPRLALRFCFSQVTTFQKYRLWIWLLLVCLVVYMSKEKVAFFGGLAFSSQSELFEIALIGWKKAKPLKKPLLFRTDMSSDVNRLSSVSALVDNPENCLMGGLYHMHQANAT